MLYVSGAAPAICNIEPRGSLNALCLTVCTADQFAVVPGTGKSARTRTRSVRTRTRKA